MFARLREILADPYLADYERWSELRELLDEWENEEERTQAIAYADAHLTLPAMERDMYRFAPEAPHWPLVRKLRLEQDAFAKLDEATLDGIDFSHITIVESTNYSAREDVDELARFTGLERLFLYGCKSLKSLQGLEGLESFRSLRLAHGYMSDNWPFPEAVFALDRLPQLRELSLSGFFEPQRMGWLEALPWLESLDLHLYGGTLVHLGFLSAMPDLKKLELSGLSALSTLKLLASAASPTLESLSLRDGQGLVSLYDLGELGQLKELRLRNCHSLSSLHGLEQLVELETLELWDFPKLNDISALAELPKLREISIHDAPKLKDIEPLGALDGLRSLRIGGCRGVKDISPLAALTGLEALAVSCRHQTELSALSPLTTLRSLVMSECGKLANIDDLAPLVELEELALDDCKVLSSIEGLAPLQGLHKLILKGCKKLEDIDVIGDLQGLRVVSLYYSRSIQDVTPLCRLPHLHDLNLTGCSGIKKSLRSRHFGEKRLAEWRSKVMPKSKLPRKEPLAAVIDHSLLPGVSPQISPEEEDFVLAEYKPPTKLKEAEALAVFGNKVLPLLKRVPKQKAGAAKAAIRTLGLIGTPEALEVLADYRDETRKAPIAEMLRSAAGFDDPAAVGELLLAGRDIKSLKLSSTGLSDLSCLAPLTSLEELDLSQNREIRDLSPLAGLTNLRELDLAVCSSVSDLSPLAELDALEKLRLYWMPVDDLSPLAAPPSLGDLYLHGMQLLQDLSPLAEMPSLHTLNLFMSSRIESFAPLERCQQLASLGMDCEARSASLEPLISVSSLQSLYLNLNQELSEPECLAELQQLVSLRVFGGSHYWVYDATPQLIDLVGQLTHLLELGLSNLEAWVDASALAPLVELQKLSLSYVGRLEEETIPAFPRLQTLFLDTCRGMASLDFLRGMPALTSLRLNSCPALKDISALAELPALRELHIQRCTAIEGIELVESLELEQVKLS